MFIKSEKENVRFEVFTAVTLKNGVFWVVTPCGSCFTLVHFIFDMFISNCVTYMLPISSQNLNKQKVHGESHKCFSYIHYERLYFLLFL
jgi:hypothetical protein